ncbi:MAG: JAB domain-containing protein [Rugosibacter sp.]|nr:JAB domain-containing protein [Rugosibacter sp.]
MSQLSHSLDSSLLVRDVAGDYRPANADEVLQAAQRVLAGQMRDCEALTSPQVVRDFLRVKLGTLEHEVFGVIHLDAQNRVIDYVEMFRGTVSQTSVYPREVVKEALARNSAALLLVHNHPSGAAEPWALLARPSVARHRPGVRAAQWQAARRPPTRLGLRHRVAVSVLQVLALPMWPRAVPAPSASASQPVRKRSRTV